MASNSSTAVNHGQRLPETSSRCSTEIFTAAHNFELDNYPLLDDMGADKYVSSSVFTVGGYDWTIRFYPDGDGNQKNCGGNVSAFLYCSSQANNVKTKFSLNLLEKKGKIGLTKYGLLEHTFSPPTYDFGYPEFFEKSRLRSSPEFKTGCFIIRCVLTVTKEPRTEEIKRNLTVVPQPNLQDHLQQMLKDGQGADVTFSVSGRLLNAHRYLLAARSPVFKAELFGPMKEKETQTIIEIHDIEPSVFEALLHFVYTDSLLLDDEHNKQDRVAKFQHLLVAADRYGLERLRLLCESKLCVDIDMDTVAVSLALAEQHHCKDLKEACIQFMAPRNVLQAVMATNRFKHLVESCPFVIIELLDMLCRNG
jgi:speckle-type POZ protein